jgi:MerR family transcriptional regulator, thiopeptide resistance regulator
MHTAGGCSRGRRPLLKYTMETYSISQLARSFGLSRSTLLYYDRIGLLRAPRRTTAGYRCYTQHEYDRLARICRFRDTGLSLADIQKVLSGGTAPSVKILEKRLEELENEMRSLRSRQRLLVSMLKKMTSDDYEPVVGKKMWVEMLAAAGMDEAAMANWHAEFEHRAPAAHDQFLLSLGISESEAGQIRKWARTLKANVAKADH